MVDSRENYKFDLGVNGLILVIYCVPLVRIVSICENCIRQVPNLFPAGWNNSVRIKQKMKQKNSSNFLTVRIGKIYQRILFRKCFCKLCHSLPVFGGQTDVRQLFGGFSILHVVILKHLTFRQISARFRICFIIHIVLG